MKGIYIHIPFCRKICNYCDFYKMVVSDKFKSEYIDYLIKDIELTFDKYNIQDVNTLYIGGGTPSCLPLNLLEKLFITLLKKVELSKLEEFTIEVNPEDLTNEFVTLIKRYYVSRVSIGVQTFDIRNYSVLGRYTDYEILKHKIELLRNNNINNYSLDLIYAIPNTTLENLEKDIDLILSLKPNHISTYSLILEEKTILYHQYLKHNIEMIDEKIDAKMYELIQKKLLENDYYQYETSNFSLSGYESKHNLIYWNYDEYYGIGAAGSSFVGNKRFTRVSNIKEYYRLLDLKEEPCDEIEILDQERLIEDYIMLGLRKTKGINVEEFIKRFEVSIFDIYPKIKQLIDDDLLKFDNNYLYINKKYLYISNFIISKILFD